MKTLSSEGTENTITPDELELLAKFFLILMQVDQRIKKSKDKDKCVGKN